MNMSHLSLVCASFCASYRVLRADQLTSRWLPSLVTRSSFPIVLLSLVLTLPALLLGCSSDDDTADSNSGQGNPVTSVFANSDAVIEQFGSTKARNLEPDIDSASLDSLVNAINDFSFDLQRAVASANPDKGLVVSGYSASTAFSLATAGTAGDTRSSLLNLLGVSALDESEVHAGMNALALALDTRANDDLVLRTANRVFVRPGLPLMTEYLDVATGSYDAPITEANFAGATDEVTRLVNDWVSQQTDGFIPSIIERFDPGTVVALLNALFLDATWQQEYEDIGTLDFTGLDNEREPVPAFGGRGSLGFIDNEDLQGLELPYAGGEIAMLILVPTNLAEFENALTAERLNALLEAMTTLDVDFQVPKWEDEVKLDLSALLTPLGLPPSPWNFGRLTDDPMASTLDVQAIQKARIEVDENGTRAAAVTAIIGITSAPDGNPQRFIADRPFIYLLRDRTSGVVLFSGRVTSPGSS